jgi:NTP pyrophosphatase (non-canonical NTP hydrolase)
MKQGDLWLRRSPCLIEYGNKKMNDKNCNIEDLRKKMVEFIKERKWEKFHNPKNVSMSIAIEAAELMEHFQWNNFEEVEEFKNDPKKMEEIRDELADIFTYILSFSNSMDIDLTDAVIQKMKKNRLKYPSEKFQGNYEKVNL